ncbi:unnamed protein product [Protopolystoma xenopodis]|uniref:Uncharacterized protein n=1 Tax=Protopolystoma xenopodis TaxID=117903 RepID=A0A3S5FGE8_9PLAT|nr:unnamed protein product [Protopolystoma xenopodis]
MIFALIGRLKLARHMPECTQSREEDAHFGSHLPAANGRPRGWVGVMWGVDEGEGWGECRRPHTRFAGAIYPCPLPPDMGKLRSRHAFSLGVNSPARQCVLPVRCLFHKSAEASSAQTGRQAGRRATGVFC